VRKQSTLTEIDGRVTYIWNCNGQPSRSVMARPHCRCYRGEHPVSLTLSNKYDLFRNFRDLYHQGVIWSSLPDEHIIKYKFTWKCLAICLPTSSYHGIIMGVLLVYFHKVKIALD